MKQSIDRILILGCGYVGERFALACLSQDMRVFATTRNPDRVKVLENMGVTVSVVATPADLPITLLQSMHAVLDSIPLSRNAKGMHASQLQWLPKLAEACSQLQWAAYLSTTGVYGDADGAWVDETWQCQPSSARGTERLLAEQAWLASGLPAEVFRLAGIYGPERNIFARLQAGGYQTVAWNPPHYSSRIHVDDIIATLLAAMQQPRVGRILNVSDNMPLPHVDYVCEVAKMLGVGQPEILSEAEGEVRLSAAALAFFKDNKRVSNTQLRAELLPQLKYPDFKSAIAHMIAFDKERVTHVGS